MYVLSYVLPRVFTIYLLTEFPFYEAPDYNVISTRRYNAIKRYKYVVRRVLIVLYVLFILEVYKFYSKISRHLCRRPAIEIN